MSPPPWSWISLDGKSVAAIPSYNRIDIVDTQDFSLLGRIQPSLVHVSFHEHSIVRTIWNARRVCLLSLSPTALAIHAPDREKKTPCSSFTLRWFLPLEMGTVSDVAFSRCGQALLLGGAGGLSLWNATTSMEFVSWWSQPDHGCDMVEFSPCRTVFATHQTNSSEVYVWRHSGKKLLDESIIPQSQVLGHDEEVEFISWKPTQYQPQTSDDHDGTVASQWDEPACVLLTITRTKNIRIWTEKQQENACVMSCVAFLQPSPDIDILHARWIAPRAQNISQEYFGAAASAAALPRERLKDWLSVVDSRGVLHVWTVDALHLSTPKLLQSGFVFKVDGEIESGEIVASSLVSSYQVAGYFSQGFLSSVTILLERVDQVLLSYVVTWTPAHPPVLKERSWYRGHTAPIAALATHPSLPLLASVSHPTAESSELIIFWLSLSMFTSESHFVPSCILQCPTIAAVHWIPTQHFQARPLLLVTFASGRWEVYSPYDQQISTLLESPRARSNSGTLLKSARHRNDSMHYPWTYHEHELGESGFEYEVTLAPHPTHGLGLSFYRVEDKILVAGFTRDDSSNDTSGDLPAAACRQICVNDECILINNIPMKGKSLIDVKAAVQDAYPNTSIVLRFRSPGSHKWYDDARHHWSVVSQDGGSDGNADDAIKEEESEDTDPKRLTTLLRGTSQQVVSGGSISKFGGWTSLGHVTLPTLYVDIAVAPLYSDAGNFVSDGVLLFGITASQELHGWLGLESRKGEFDFVKLNLKFPKSSLVNITAIGTERDYRQRAFASNIDGMAPLWNALLFVGNAGGTIQHWRCRVSHAARTIDLSLVHATNSLGLELTNHERTIHPNSFFRRGFCAPPQNVYSSGVYHMELDDPNRLAVVYVNAPEDLYIWEGESGLGMLRLEAIVQSEGRGNIMGFCWCSGHVEFHVDPLAVHYTTSLVIYTYDLHHQTWIAQSEQSVFFPLFDCTRDASALVLTAGSLFPGSESYHEVPTVHGKWDAHRHADQADQKHYPVWHPYTLLTTICGMPARVGLTHTMLADYRPNYDLQTAFGEAEQMLKLLAHVLEDDASTDSSAENGVLILLHEKKVFGRRASIGRYASHPSNAPLSRAEDLFAPSHRGGGQSRVEIDTHTSLTTREVDTLLTALDAVMRKHTQKIAVRYDEQENRNAYVLFESFELEHILELKGLLLFLQKMQTFMLNGYDLPAQRYFVAYLLTTCLQEVMLKTDNYMSVSNMHLAQYDDSTGFVPTVDSYLHEVPSSSVVWALHSQSQNLLIEQCIHPQALWDDLRPLWPGLWVRDPNKLRAIMERVAKCTFTRTKDAMSVCLLYIALNKQNILGALAKVSRVESNKTLAEFLSHNFTEERWSNAAVRNAFSLLRKKQYDLAAAFFLLPNPPRLQESLRIIVSRLHDPGLAMVIARLMEYEQQPHVMEDTSDIFHVGEQTTDLLRNDLIPHFRNQHNRWLESAALWWLHDFDQSSAVLQPSSQLVDVVDSSLLKTMQSPTSENESLTLVLRTKMAMDFLINLTSLPLFFQFSYCEMHLPLMKFAYSKLLDLHPTLKEEDLLTTKNDVDHAYSFSAYVCKHTGLSDTALLQMLQARHLLNVHVKKNYLSILDTRHQPIIAPPTSAPTTSTDFKQRSLRAQLSFRYSPKNHFFGSPRVGKHGLGRRMSFSSFSLDTTTSDSDDWVHLLPDDEKVQLVSLWPKAEVADMECRRWSSSAFVGKMIGMRVAREMISHFRVHSHDNVSNHQIFLRELLDPLSAQFQVDRQYILEATLSVLQPHAPLHLVECCFVLSELNRTQIMQEWIQCIGLSMLHATSHFSTVEWTDEVLKEWKHITLQLISLQQFSDDESLVFPQSIRLIVRLAIQLGSVVLAWCTNHPESLADIIMTDIPIVLERFLVGDAIDIVAGPCHRDNFGYTFLDQSYQPTTHLLRVRQLYSTILMTQIVRTVYSNDQKVLLQRSRDVDDEGFDDTTDNGCNGLYMPKTLWRSWTKHPLSGLKRWYLAMEAHVQLELHGIVHEQACQCGHFGLDMAVRPYAALVPEDAAVPTENFKDSELMLWMQHPVTGVPTTLRRFRLDPRVFVACFTLRDAFVWLDSHGICNTLEETHVLLARWCSSRRVRWLVRRRSEIIDAAERVSKVSLEMIPDEAFCFVSPWEIDAEHNLSVYMHGGGHPEREKAAVRVELGWESLSPLSDDICEEAARLMFPNEELKSLWKTVRGEGWLVTAVQHFEADGLYMKQSVHQSTDTRSKFLADLYKQVQRNRLFRYLGLPHRIIAVVNVDLIEGKDMLACDILSHTADPYVFLTLTNDSLTGPPLPSPNAWSIQSYRSRCGVATLQPKWGTPNDRFPFRIALPVHESHETSLPPESYLLEALLQHAYSGPPTTLWCSVYNKCKVRQHPFMGCAKISLKNLTASQPMDVWVDLEDVETGSLHFQISLKYQLMSTTSFDEDFSQQLKERCMMQESEN